MKITIDFRLAIKLKAHLMEGMCWNGELTELVKSLDIYFSSYKSMWTILVRTCVFVFFQLEVKSMNNRNVMFALNIVLDRTNFLRFWIFGVDLSNLSLVINFCPLAWPSDFVYHPFLYSIVLLSSLNKEMTSSSTVPSKLFFLSDRAEHGCSVSFVPFLKMK